MGKLPPASDRPIRRRQTASEERPTTFLRFVIPRRDGDSHSRLGVLAAAHELRDSGNLESYEHELLCKCLAWFNEHVRIPAVLSEPGNARAISWFKADARTPVRKMWELVALLRSHGLHVELLRTDAPGSIVYEDKWQAVAKPSPRDRTKRRW